VLNRKHLGVAALRRTAATAVGHLCRGQTNFVRMLRKFSRIYNPERQYADHGREVTYAMQPPRPGAPAKPGPGELYIHAPGRAQRQASLV